MLERSSILSAMNTLNRQKQITVLASLVEGNSIRATCRMTGVAKGTVISLLERVGAACAKYQDEKLRKVASKRIQCDEIWSFCYAKQRNVPAKLIGKFGYGDVWTWTALDPDSKLMVCWRVGYRDLPNGLAFLRDLQSRLANRVQLTTDGWNSYYEAVEGAFGTEIDYGMVVKLYGKELRPETRYSPSVCYGAKKKRVMGKPDMAHVSTSYVERQNLTMRMGMRRFTRLTNAFSKKVDNLAHAVALHFMYYNFCRVHQTLRVTPAMEAGISRSVWTLENLLSLLD